MPRDLFADSVRTAPPTAKPPGGVAASVAAHVVIVATLLCVEVVAPGVSPMPRGLLAFVAPPALNPVTDVELPSTPRAAHEATPVSPSATPTAAPDRLRTAPGTQGLSADPDALAVAMIEAGSGVVVGPLGSETTVPPPPPAVQRPIRLHAGIAAPRKITNVEPAYPALARAAHVEGVVIIEATIDAHGNVASARVLRSLPLLDEAAISAVRQWTFTPALLNGVPIPVVMTVTVRFALE